MKPEIIECEKCGTYNDEFLLFKGKCYNCSEKWFCSICGEETEKGTLENGICEDCQ